ncbi:MAG: hypothetical protein R3211_04170 [Balneolaceae bacterium]|nr:hypothetical protein [Balneolaceae bacterium]
MELEVTDIYLVDVHDDDDSVDLKNMNTDIIVSLKNGDKYVASFISYNCLYETIEKNKRTGEFLSGRYYWMKNMVLVQNLYEGNVRQIINHLIADGDFQIIFEKI